MTRTSTSGNSLETRLWALASDLDAGTVIGVLVFGAFAVFMFSLIFGIAAVITFVICVVAILILGYIVYRRLVRLQFLREAPGRIQSCMATVSENLAAGAGHLATAERELEASTAPLFWDAMDEFGPSMMRSRTAWNGAADIAERYAQLSAGTRYDQDGAIVPDAALPATIAELGEKWMNLRRRALGNEHFASIFEQRRQADKIAERLKKQGEEIQAAIDAARRAELAASQASAVAGQALAIAGTASAAARSAGADARSASADARSAGADARSASADARSAGAEARSAKWSKI